MEKCAYCGEDLNKSTGHINRAKKQGLKLYCNRTCAGMGRRANKTSEQKRKEKAEYDKKYREINSELIKNKTRIYNQSEAGRAMQKRSREKKKDYHKKYCQTQEYKNYKRDYDQKYRAKNCYGEYWESFILIQEISNQYDNRVIKNQNQLINKSQIRKRSWQQKIKIKNYLQRI